MADNRLLEELELSWGKVRLRLAPGRGALVTSLVVDKTELLHLDRETFLDMSKNVRGGIPILFPFAGKLEGDRFRASETQLPQHGFARNQPWTVLDITNGSIRMAMNHAPEIDRNFPWTFTLETRLFLIERGVHMELLIINEDEKPMPVAPGWHPYFRCDGADKKSVRPLIPDFPADRLTNEAEFNFGVVPPANGTLDVQIPQLGTLRFGFSPIMRHLQWWALAGRPFVCIEPFTGPPGYVNTEATPVIPAHEARTFYFRIEKI